MTKSESIATMKAPNKDIRLVQAMWWGLRSTLNEPPREEVCEQLAYSKTQELLV